MIHNSKDVLSLTHTLISLPFAFYLENPLLIFLAAFVMHLLADTFLHWNIYPYRFKRYPYELVALDVAGGVVLAWLLTGEQLFTLPVLLAIAGGNAPDILHGVWEVAGKNIQDRYFNWAKPLFRFHDHLQLETTSVPRGLAWQVVFGIIAVLSIV